MEPYKLEIMRNVKRRHYKTFLSFYDKAEIINYKFKQISVNKKNHSNNKIFSIN